MAITAYTYSITNDFPGSEVDSSNLWDEITLSGSGISIQLEDIEINPNEDDVDRIDIIFKDALSVSEKTVLDADTSVPAGGLIAEHDSVAKIVIEEVSLNLANSGDLTLPVLRTAPTIARPGFYRCDRDFKILCGVYEDTARESLEDLKMDIPTNKRVDWGELKLSGIYKDVAGTMTACTSKADADAESILSVWDYQAIHQVDGTTPIEIELLGGGISVGNNLTTPVAGDEWKHQIYVVMAPGIPESMGGRVKFFDGFLKPFEGGSLNSLNAMALALKPNALAGNANTVIRFHLWYPKTAKDIHVIRLTTFRELGEF